MDPRSDAELLVAWRAGDEDSGRALLVRHFRPLTRFFRNKVDIGVEDLIQRTMLVCLEHADRLRDASSFRAYLFTTIRNTAYDRTVKGDVRYRFVIDMSSLSK